MGRLDNLVYPKDFEIIESTIKEQNSSGNYLYRTAYQQILELVKDANRVYEADLDKVRNSTVKGLIRILSTAPYFYTSLQRRNIIAFSLDYRDFLSSIKLNKDMLAEIEVGLKFMKVTRELAIEHYERVLMLRTEEHTDKMYSLKKDLSSQNALSISDVIAIHAEDEKGEFDQSPILYYLIKLPDVKQYIKILPSTLALYGYDMRVITKMQRRQKLGIKLNKSLNLYPIVSELGVSFTSISKEDYSTKLIDLKEDETNKYKDIEYLNISVSQIEGDLLLDKLKNRENSGYIICHMDRNLDEKCQVTLPYLIRQLKTSGFLFKS